MPARSTYIFLDSEFMTLGDGGTHILSIGLCGPTGDHEFYAENVAVPDDPPNDFAATFVIPQLGHSNVRQRTLKDIGTGLVAWLRQFEGQAVEVCYDWHEDRIALETVLQLAGPLKAIPYNACPVSYLLDDEAGIKAAESCWSETAKERGIQRHHALADALALRARFLAVHGAGALN